MRVDVLLQRYSADNKLIDTWPFVLSARADDRPATLRIGVQVPVETAGTVKVLSVGTNIDATVSMTSDQRYRALIRMQDSSLVPADAKNPLARNSSSFREFSITSLIVVQDGQATEISVGSDRVTGETLRAKVTITALK